MKKLFISFILLLNNNFVVGNNRSNEIADKQFSVVGLHDGLGNQMFLYAFGRALEHKNMHIMFDKEWFADDKIHRGTKRRLSLNVFNTKIKWASTQEINKSLYKNQKIFLNKYIMYILDKLRITKRYIVADLDIATYDVCEPFTYYDGYFQSEKYFKHIRNVLLDDFTLKIPLNHANQLMLNSIRNTNSVCLHIRRGDYANRPKIKNLMGCCSMEYYIQAIQCVMSKILDQHFFIFSDDIDWIKDTFIPKIKQSIDTFNHYTIVNINNDDTNYFDLELMKNCKHNIIANSTFSWWGAWLNNNASKIVIAPHKWFASGQSNNTNTNGLYPDGWIKI